MRHRLYYLLPDIECARRTLDDLLLSRIEQRYVHFLSLGAPLPSDLPEANILHRTDVVHGAGNGMLIGAALGLALGALLAMNVDLASPSAVVVGTTLLGLIFGGWAASMVAAALPNTRLKAFYPEIEKGKVLMIADIPASRIKEIEKVLEERHPEMRFSGEDPRIPAFP
ncbi:hypothetical protein [Noviherbaspirillum autotrophicum]|uniref:Membrane protein n=1 Tax=Noviherbaspirillum autotrophicum TaxID=709839 RepID=A0A0C2BLI1_9BURK|nr:hypothetical protein [Noviherbaspirillum autotrophicum]KIF82110.1 membrane protein [Noviherbaspirillum autotrophicum]